MMITKRVGGRFVRSGITGRFPRTVFASLWLCCVAVVLYVAPSALASTSLGGPACTRDGSCARLNDKGTPTPLDPRRSFLGYDAPSRACSSIQPRNCSCKVLTLGLSRARKTSFKTHSFSGYSTEAAVPVADLVKAFGYDTGPTSTTLSELVATNTGGKPGQQQLFDTEPYDLVPESAPKPLGRGSTGSARPNNLNEQLAMNEARSNPGAGQPVPVKGGMADSRWPASEGWVKMRQNVNSVEVHYVQNTKTGAVDDFKFK